ncbi:MAG: hypothetical protein QG635_1984 [Bacteroidota bacterium]|nr:hypothetical protein [Bacteroidota bacterium]
MNIKCHRIFHIRNISFCIFLLFSSGLSARTNIDSLEKVLNSTDKTDKLKILHTLSEYYSSKLPNKSIKYSEQAIIIADEIRNPEERLTALINLGNVYLNLGDNAQSLQYYDSSLKEARKEKNLLFIAKSFLKIGYLSTLKSNYPEALKYHFDALKIFKTIDNKSGMADSYHYIGIIYYYLMDFENALMYSNYALEIREEQKDKIGISNSLNNIALLYSNLGNKDMALEYN